MMKSCEFMRNNGEQANWVYNQSSFLSELEAPLSTVPASAVLVRAVSNVQAVASTPLVELFVDGKSAGVQSTIRGIANFPGYRGEQRGGGTSYTNYIKLYEKIQNGTKSGFETCFGPSTLHKRSLNHICCMVLVFAGARTNITAVGIDRNGTRVSSHQLLNGTKPASRMTVCIDVPAKSTGTGEALFMDGQDVAMVVTIQIAILGK